LRRHATKPAAATIARPGTPIDTRPNGMPAIAFARMTSVSAYEPTIHAAPASHGTMPGSRHARPSATHATSSASPIAYGSRSANSSATISMARQSIA